MHPQGWVSDDSAYSWTGAKPQVWVTWLTWGLFVSFPAREDEEQMPSMASSNFQPSKARDRYTPVLDAAAVAQRGTKPMASHQSSLTSLEESRPSELLRRKALLRAGGPHTEVSVLVWWSEDPLMSESCSWPLLSLALFMCPRFLPDTVPVCAAVKPAHQSACATPLLPASLLSCALCPFVSVSELGPGF